MYWRSATFASFNARQTNFGQTGPRAGAPQL